MSRAGRLSSLITRSSQFREVPVTLRTILCNQCSQPFDAARNDAVTCSAACRTRRARATITARRAALAAQAEAAAQSGDVVALTRAARATVALLTE